MSRVGGQCQLDWSYETRVWWTDDSVPGVPLSGSYRPVQQWRRSQPGPDGLPAEMEAGMQGSLRAARGCRLPGVALHRDDVDVE